MAQNGQQWQKMAQMAPKHVFRLFFSRIQDFAARIALVRNFASSSAPTDTNAHKSQYLVARHREFS
jgi:hypothetical protein